MWLNFSRRRYRKKMNLLKFSRFPDFVQYLPDFSQCFPDFSLTKFFKVRKCERCDSLNPRLFSHFFIGISSTHGLWHLHLPTFLLHCQVQHPFIIHLLLHVISSYMHVQNEHSIKSNYHLSSFHFKCSVRFLC